MLKTHSKPNFLKEKSGTFVVEFAVVGLFLAAALAFCSDAVISISTKGKLDRLSYSAVSLIKERTVLFGIDNTFISNAEFEQIDRISQNSLQRMIGGFDVEKYGIEIDYWTPDRGSVSLPARGGFECLPEPELTENMSVMTSWGRKATLYRITLCYETPNMLGRFIARDQGLAQSSSLTIGR